MTDINLTVQKKGIGPKFLVYLAFLITIGVVLFLCMSCTTSVTTISSHGTASDMVDQEQDASPTISPNLTIPVR